MSAVVTSVQAPVAPFESNLSFVIRAFGFHSDFVIRISDFPPLPLLLRILLLTLRQRWLIRWLLTGLRNHGINEPRGKIQLGRIQRSLDLVPVVNNPRAGP